VAIERVRVSQETHTRLVGFCGSITAGVLGFKWSKLTFDANGVASNFVAEVVAPVRGLAGKTIDEGSIIGGIFTPGISIADKITEAYRKHLFGNATLQDLPNDPPRFVINATNVQTEHCSGSRNRFLLTIALGCFEIPKLNWPLPLLPRRHSLQSYRRCGSNSMRLHGHHQVARSQRTCTKSLTSQTWC
jgi:hypothetical protein